GEGFDLALGIDFDFTSLAYANRTLMGLMSADEDLQSALWSGGAGQLYQIFEECLATLGKPAEGLGKKDRIKLVALMDQKNAFSFR
ncbi:transcriptional regulator, partial [Klebsiella oxytoca]